MPDLALLDLPWHGPHGRRDRVHQPGLLRSRHQHPPARDVAALDRGEQVALVRFTVGADHAFRFGIGRALDALHGLETHWNQA